MVNTFHAEGSHVAHDALQRSVDLHFGQKKIGEYPVRIARLLVFVMLRRFLFSLLLDLLITLGVNFLCKNPECCNYILQGITDVPSNGSVV